MLIEKWTEEAGTFCVLRLKFEHRVTEIIEALETLPSGSKIWEMLPYEDDQVDVVFCSVAATAGAVA